MTSTLYLADTIATMNAHNEVLTAGAVLVTNKSIAAIGSAASLKSQYPGATVVNLENSLLMPGLVNSHAHTPMPPPSFLLRWRFCFRLSRRYCRLFSLH